jgi:hypothetical protein
VLAGWRKERQALVEQLGVAESQTIPSPERETARVMADLAQLRETFRTADPATLRSALATVIKEIVLFWEPGGARKRRFLQGEIRVGDNWPVAITSLSHVVGIIQLPAPGNSYMPESG